MFGGYIASTLIGLIGSPRSRSTQRAAARIGALAGFSIVAGILSVVLLRASFDVFAGHVVALSAIAALTIFASGAATAGIQAAIGPAGTGLVIIVFVIVGNAAAGGPFARPLLPGFWRTIGGVLPPGASVDLARSALFFDGARIAGPILVLVDGRPWVRCSRSRSAAASPIRSTPRREPPRGQRCESSSLLGPAASAPGRTGGEAGQPRGRLSHELEGWLSGDGDKTVGSLVSLFGQRSFAVLFVLLLGVPALPLPTGGATHVFELIAMLLALQLIVGRDRIWLPQRWCRLSLAGSKQQRFIAALMRMIRRLERISRRRLGFLFGHRLSQIAFGVLALAGTLGAFLAPPFTGLDTLPALGVVLMSLGVLLEDIAIVVLGITVGAGGVFLEIVLGKAAVHWVSKLF